MGLFDTLRQVLGTSAETDATKRASPEDLFGMSTAYLTMQADLGWEPEGTAALCFSGVDSSQFEQAKTEVRAILDAGKEETGTHATFHSDAHGYQWVVLDDDDPEDLVTSIHFAADQLIEEGFGSRLLAALFTFAKDDTLAYWVYSFRRGAYYPFVPRPGTNQHDRSTEFKLESILDGELELEPEKEYWYPLWPDQGPHPWD